ncbi:ABC transporter permease [Candidatus Bathyarchaeota archaeon]|nr:ABC transporter permease [Candidatus Bathyarchaeota archaeon]
MPQKRRIISSWREFWRRYKRGKFAVVCLFVFIAMCLISIFAPFIAPYGPLKTLEGEPFQPPSLAHLMGTDNLGRDIFSEVLFGARVSLFIAALALLTSTIIGVLVGSLAGYYGGLFDEFLMRITDFFIIIPSLLFAIIIVIAFGTTIMNIALTIGLLNWSYTAKVTRAEFITLKERGFVEAARALGESNSRIIFWEILPNAGPSVIVMCALNMTRGILLEAMLSFLGVGDSSQASLGLLLYYAQKFPYVWWMIVFPGAVLFITALSANVVADGLNDAFNPKLSER